MNYNAITAEATAQLKNESKKNLKEFWKILKTYGPPLTSGMAQQIMSITRQGLFMAVKEGHIRRIQFGDLVLYSGNDVEKYIEEHRTTYTQPDVKAYLKETLKGAKNL